MFKIAEWLIYKIHFQSIISSQSCASSSFASPQKISNYLYCRSDRKGPDCVIFSYRITPDACSSLCLRLSDPTSAFEPLAGIRKEWRQERKGERKREESVRWRFEGGNELPASTTLVMTRLSCLSLSSLRRSFPSVIPRQWSHLKPPARRQNDSLDSLLNEMLHFPILLNFLKIEALYFSFTAGCNTRYFGMNRLLSDSNLTPLFAALSFPWHLNLLRYNATFARIH